MKATSAVIKDQIDTWSQEVYYSNTYKIAKQIFMKESRKYPSYVPSYIMTYTRNNKLIGNDIEDVWKSMIERENQMFKIWSEGSERNVNALDEFLYGNQYGTKSMKDIINKGWSSRLRAIMGKDPTDRQIFNHFLHHFVSEKKRYYFEQLQYEYIEPLLEKKMKMQKQKIALATSEAISNTLQKMKKLPEITEEKEKKKKVVFFSSDVDEDKFRESMQKDKRKSTDKDNRIAAQSNLIQSQKRVHERQQFRQDMNELAKDLKEVQSAMIIAQAQEEHNKNLARDKKFEDRKKDFQQSNQAKYDARMKKYNDSIPKSGSTSKNKALYQSVGTTNSKVNNKQLTQSKPKEKSISKKEDSYCGYDISEDGNWILKEHIWMEIMSKDRIDGRAKKIYSYRDDGLCELVKSDVYKSGYFEVIHYKEKKEPWSLSKEVWKNGKMDYRIEDISYDNGKIVKHKTGGFKNDSDGIYDRRYTSEKEWHLFTGKLILHIEAYKNGRWKSSKQWNENGKLFLHDEYDKNGRKTKSFYDKSLRK